MDTPDDWLALVNAPQTEAELAALRHALRRGTPFGSDAWRAATAAALGLTFTLRPHGRPRKQRWPAPADAPACDQRIGV